MTQCTWLIKASWSWVEFSHKQVLSHSADILFSENSQIQQHNLKSNFLFVNMHVAFSWKWGTFIHPIRFPSTIVRLRFPWKNVLNQEIELFSAPWWPAAPAALLSKCKYLGRVLFTRLNSLAMQASRSYVADLCTFTQQAQALLPLFN